MGRFLGVISAPVYDQQFESSKPKTITNLY